MEKPSISEKLTMNETELAQRWGISPKTLQRWRCESRGPKYWKLSKRVVYPIEEVISFEKNALYDSTSSKVPCTSDCPPSAPDTRPPTRLYSVREAATITGFPAYYFSHPQVRRAFRIPHLYVGKMVRFDLDQLKAWGERHSQELRRAENEDDPSSHFNDQAPQLMPSTTALSQLM